MDRAAKSCEDNVRDQLTSETSSQEQTKLQRQYEDCVSREVDDHLSKLPVLIKKLLKEGNKIHSS